MNRKFCEKCTRHSFANDVDIIELCPKHRMVDELIAVVKAVEFDTGLCPWCQAIFQHMEDCQRQAVLAKVEPKENGQNEV
jgi:hypothetical protein